jgi:hypothetical protein
VRHALLARDSSAISPQATIPTARIAIQAVSNPHLLTII